MSCVQVKSSLKGGRPGTAGLDAMSPAAQRLVSSKLGNILFLTFFTAILTLLHLPPLNIPLGRKLWIRDILVRIRTRGSVPLTYGSGSVLFVSNFQVFLLIISWRYIFIILQRYKVIKKSQNSRNYASFYYFCMMMEGFGS